MSLPLYISRKYTLSKKDSRFINLISVIAVTGISLGVATLIIALSILKGFEDTLTRKIIDFDAHIQLNSYKTFIPGNKLPSVGLFNKLPKGTEINPFLSSLAIISSRRIQEGVNVKGIEPENKSIQIKSNIIEGSFDLHDTNENKIIIGRKLANKLFLKLGDKVTVFALANDQLPSPENLPNIKKFVITGIFESGMSEYDDLIAYINIEQAQGLFNYKNSITGYDIKLRDISMIDSITTLLNQELSYPYYARSIYQTHRNIFTWIDLQKKPIPIILGLIIIVAVFNIVGTLLMIVLEKTNAIGILKSLGAKRNQVIKIFIYQGVFLSIIGITIGNILAFLLTYLQLEFKIISLPSSVYFMSSVPILLKPETFILVSVLTLILSVIASIIPSYIASKINPVSTLRFS